jgi:hypothetical protein
VPFYSRSYLFGFAIPFTHTGILGTYSFNDEWSVTAGVTRGWEQSWEDNNEALDFLGQVKWVASKQTTFILNVVSGPEQADNEDNWRTVIDLIVSHTINDKWSVGFNADYGWEQDATAGGADAQWYGVAGYVAFVCNDQVTLNGRAEWFRDDDGTRIGVDADFYELTIGLAWTPFPDDAWGKGLIIRPELRGDFSTEDVFNDGDDLRQFTAGIDVIYKI